MSVVINKLSFVAVCLESGLCLVSAFVCEECVIDNEIRESLVYCEEAMMSQVGVDE